MSDQTSSSPFQFNSKIDADYIFSMYEDDYQYIETMFKTVIDHFGEDRDAIITHYRDGQLDELRKSVHKIKPAFGFVGMPAVLDICKDFENKCYEVDSIAKLEIDYLNMVNSLEDAYQVITSEHQKLVSYNLTAA